MKRQLMTLGVLAAVVCSFALWASPARGQEPRVLYGDMNSISFVSRPIRGALGDLGLDFTLVFSDEDFLNEVRFRRWDLVILRSKRRFIEPLEFEIITELEAHVASGGALHFQMADLDSAPQELLDVLGVAEAIELVDLHDIFVPNPAHPVWNSPGGGFFRLGDEFYPPDFGDTLVPGPGAFAVGFYGVGGGAAITIGRDGRVIVNGQQWDNWEPGGGVARNQIAWLLGCPADLDGDGDLTVFDFLEFQRLFDAGDPLADVFYDGRFDVFDFLEFFNQFEVGCR